MAEELLATIRLEMTQFRQNLQQVQRDIHQMSQQTSNAMGTLNTALGAVRGGLAALGVSVGLSGLVQLAKDAAQAALQSQALTTAFRAITGSAQGAKEELAFVRGEANRLGLDFSTLAKGYQGLAAASRGTRLEGEAARQVFSAVAQASRTMSLSAEQTGGVLTALQQIMSKGTVQSEELRGQLGERLPGAFQIAARAMGVTTAELGKMLEQGRVLSDDFLPKFAAQLRKELGGGAEEAAKQAGAAFARLGNEITQLAATVGQGILTMLAPVANIVTDMLAQIRQARLSGEELQKEIITPELAGRNIRLEELTQRERAEILGRVPGAPAGRTRQELLDEIQKAVEERRKISREAARTGTTAGFPPVEVESSEAEARERIRQARRNVGRTAEQEGQELLNELQKVEEARKDAEREAKRREQEAKQRRDRERDLERQTIAVTAEKYEAERQQLRLTVQELREQKLSETKIVAFEAEKRHEINVREIQATVTLMEEEAQRREQVEEEQTTIKEREAKQRQEIENTIAALTQDATKTQLDDFKESLEQRRQALVEHGADVDQLRRFDEAREGAIRRKEVEENEKALKEQERQYQQFAKRVQDTTADFIFDALSGRIKGFTDLLTSMKNFFLRVLADMAAAALARPIIIPVITAVTSALGLNTLLSIAPGLVGGAGGESGGLGGLLGLGSTASSISGALGGPTLSSTLGGGGGALSSLGSLVLLGGASAGPVLLGAGGGLTTAGLASSGLVGGATLGSGAVLSGAIGGTAGSLTGGTSLLAGGAGGLGLGGAGAGAATGLTLGTAGLAAGVGLGAGFTLRQLNNLIGLTDLLGSRGSSALAGAGGGAAAGAIAGSAIPVIGTAIGALAGALLGALGGGLFGGAAPVPRFTGTGGQAPTLAFEPGLGITIPDMFAFTGRGQNIGRGATTQIQAALAGAATELFGQLESTMRQFPEALQEKALPVLQGLSEGFEVHFSNLKFAGENLQKDLERWMTQDLPRVFSETFDPFIENLKKIAPIFEEFGKVITALEQRQAQLLGGITGARQAISEALLSPAELFERRRDTLEETLTRFRAGTRSEQVGLVPTLTTLTQEVFRLGTAQEVFGDDTGELRELQREMLDILRETETVTRDVFGEAIQATQDQQQILLDTFAVQSNIEGLMHDAVTYLRTLTELLQPIGSFQTNPGQWHRIGSTGLALVHRGEYVGRPGSSTSFNSDIHVTVVVPPGTDARGIGQATATQIRSTQRALHDRERYRQRGTL